MHMLDIGHVKVNFFDLPKMSDMPLCQVRLVFVKIGDRTQYKRPLYECPKGGVTSPIFGTFQSNTESAAAQRINRHAHGITAPKDSGKSFETMMIIVVSRIRYPGEGCLIFRPKENKICP